MKSITTQDNIKAFMNAYKANVATISIVAMHKYTEYDEDLLSADICWLVTDNMIELLAIKKLMEFSHLMVLW